MTPQTLLAGLKTSKGDIIMNFEIFCFDLDNLNDIVHKEYVESYVEARQFEMANQDKYSCISITPMNEQAEHEMACINCGGKYGSCEGCRHDK